MKKTLLILLAVGCLVGCSKKDDDKIDCKIYWQLYHLPKYLGENDIEKAFQDTFFEFYEKVNDNTVIARNTTIADVRSLTLKLASMADNKITDIIDPSLDYHVEMRIFIDFNGSYVDEVWSKSY